MMKNLFKEYRSLLDQKVANGFVTNTTIEKILQHINPNVLSESNQKKLVRTLKSLENILISLETILIDENEINKKSTVPLKKKL